MLKPLRKLFAFSAPPTAPAVPAGQRVYAIGDIHGRLDLLSRLADAIEADNAASGPARSTVVLLGDLVDRGPDSAGVIAFARAWQSRRRVRIIAGNHEEMFLNSFERTSVLRQFLRFGGDQTVLSYGLDQETYHRASLEELQRLMLEVVPRDDLAFLASFEDRIEIGDYLFVHAGVLPDVPPEDQKVHDLRWIREPFLSHDKRLSHIVVHGHTITDEVDERINRIGLDTGAYMSDRLTALVLEGTQRRYIAACGSGDDIRIETRDSAPA